MNHYPQIRRGVSQTRRGVSQPGRGVFPKGRKLPKKDEGSSNKGRGCPKRRTTFPRRREGPDPSPGLPRASRLPSLWVRPRHPVSGLGTDTPIVSRWTEPQGIAPALRTTNQAPPFAEPACQIDAIRGAPPRLSLGNLPGKKLAMGNVREVICERRKHLL